MSFLGKETMKKKLYFGKWIFLALVLRNSLYFLIFEKAETLEQFFLFQESETLKSFLYIRKYKFLSPSPKNKSIHPRKTFLYFRT